MRYIAYTTPGPSSVLRLGDKDVPEPGPGEVRVRMLVSGVNPTDWKTRGGARRASTRAPVQVPGHDGAGLVDAVGAGVHGIARGTRVWVWEAAWQRADGTAQEYVVLPASNVVPLPDSATFDDGACLGIPALTAHRALTAHDGAPRSLRRGSLSGKTVLVTGGAGAVGHAAIQLATWSGARVVATVSSERKAQLARRSGAHLVLNYRTDDVAARVREFAPGGADIVVEVAARANLAVSLEAVSVGGTIAIYTSDAMDDLALPARDCMGKNIRFQFIMVYTVPAEPKRDAVDAVRRALDDGWLSVGEDAGLPLHRFALEDAHRAHDASEQGVVGKVLIDLPHGT